MIKTILALLLIFPLFACKSNVIRNDILNPKSDEAIISNAKEIKSNWNDIKNEYEVLINDVKNEYLVESENMNALQAKNKIISLIEEAEDKKELIGDNLTTINMETTKELFKVACKIILYSEKYIPEYKQYGEDLIDYIKSFFATQS